MGSPIWKTLAGVTKPPYVHFIYRTREREREKLRMRMCWSRCQKDPGFRARLAPSSPKPLLMSLAICCSAALPILMTSSSTLLQMPIRRFLPELQRLCVIWLSSPNLQHALPDATFPLLQGVVGLFFFLWAPEYIPEGKFT